ncbi:MAG TPA: DUF3267 domain-containing protein [Anaerolineales bacterium]|nr:DUF3267 domain-containing protein [Anaerolineales bacterium]
MSTPNDPIFRSGSLPEDYQEVLYWRLTEQPGRVVALNIVGILLFIGFGSLFSTLAIRVGRLPSSFDFGLVELIMIVVGILLALIVHELTHGMAMQIFGAKPKYGALWKQMMFYATAPGFVFARNNYVIIALAPLIFISILVVLGMWLLQGTLWVALLGICGIMNASGAVGDMWITALVLRYPATAYVMDERDGVRVFLPKP